MTILLCFIFLNFILVYYMVLIFPLADLSIYCTRKTVDILGYAVDSLYPPIEINDTIIEVGNIHLL